MVLQVKWENRLDCAASGQTCFVSIDGVDFKIFEPQPFNPGYFSHKFRGPGLRYEIALNIRTGYIVWAHGGYPCGLYSDLRLAREAFVLNLKKNEKAMADKGYKDASCFILPTPLNKSQHSVIMARHETVNKRLKQFEILNQRFRHQLEKHPMIVQAVVNITQLMLQNGHPLFSV